MVDQSPISGDAARMVLDTVADLVKPNVFMRSHDIRYGAAHDMTMLPADNATSDADIAVELNHTSSTARHSGGSVTALEAYMLSPTAR